MNHPNVLVLGSTSEIGAVVALRLAHSGAAVAINGRRHPESRGPEIVEAMRAEGHNVIFAPGDMRSVEEMNQVVAATIDAFGSIHALVVCGRPRSTEFGPFLESDPHTFHSLFNDIVVSRLIAAHAVAQPMAKQGKGKIVFVTSDVGRTPTPAQPVVGAAAAATIAAGRHLAFDLRHCGIRVNTVAVTLTGGTDKFRRYKEDPDSLAYEPSFMAALASVEKHAAFGIATAEDVANAVMFFVSEESDKVSGAVLSVNGGASFPA